ncbi:hypothetical protein UFOVP891_28 [uncultured Caudovirales phage]|uniref:Uncharacterized protein n=1 Tax=uncultured Caudovirales phage TaxID=2100421 RepID=A0A6J5T3R2_9CAUD|nr:hypothetical protein UFOVP472_40 [uncultured Caudovirales phage]CAB4169066.1 hypothetical protein UFOVP891_28 [uncultured Caudovirales phage]CAB4180780.1 hypothetical protein UFOVP1053_40 [uncultured Caudovirales phage]CAB4195761.1 hypothetical protein UFOVP1297_34 [uncultured Caudovirales phage]CAB4221876.1 hypothetical protein UFOVP1647_12 [uncultured Caudovirales phage]
MITYPQRKAILENIRLRIDILRALGIRPQGPEQITICDIPPPRDISKHKTQHHLDFGYFIVDLNFENRSLALKYPRRPSRKNLLNAIARAPTTAWREKNSKCLPADVAFLSDILRDFRLKKKQVKASSIE